MTTNMSTQAYYKDRLGFDPQEALNDGMAFGKTQQGYEENLCKFKGLWDFYIESIGTSPQFLSLLCGMVCRGMLFSVDFSLINLTSFHVIV